MFSPQELVRWWAEAQLRPDLLVAVSSLPSTLHMGQPRTSWQNELPHYKPRTSWLILDKLVSSHRNHSSRLA